MAVTTDWTPLTPGGSDNPKQGDDEIRNMKSAIQERMRNGGHVWATVSTGAANTNDGKIACGVQGTNTLALYETNATTACLTINDSTKTVTLGDGTTGATRYGLTVGGTTRLLAAVRSAVTLIATATYSVATTDYVILCSYNGAVTITLPAAAALAGRTIHIKRNLNKATANTITLATGTAGDKIETATTYVFANSSTVFQSVKVQSDGATDWYVVGAYTS